MFNPIKLVTLNVDEAYQPTTRETGRTGEFKAYAACYVVDCFTAYEDTCSVVTFDGMWDTEEKARAYARSCGDARARYASPYWYVPGYGRVATPNNPRGLRSYEENNVPRTVAA